MLTNPQRARATFDPIAKAQLQNSSLVRVKIWTPEGRVLYSEEPRLTGARFQLDDEARNLHCPSGAQSQESATSIGRRTNSERPAGALWATFDA
jgi:two-component system NarL family sensor kinase